LGGNQIVLGFCQAMADNLRQTFWATTRIILDLSRRKPTMDVIYGYSFQSGKPGPAYLRGN
jgi:hypothetical protein